MKTVGKPLGKKSGKHGSRAVSSVVMGGALALLAGSPRAASAQVVNGFLRSGAVSAPVSPQVAPPSRPGVVFTRPGESFGPSANFNPPAYNQPNYNQPSQNLRNFGPPVYNNVPIYSTGPVYRNGLNYSNRPFYDNAPRDNNYNNYNNTVPGFRSERPSGPVVTVPDAAQPNPGIRYHRPSFGGSVGSVNGSSNLSGYPFGTPLRPVGPAYGPTHTGRSGGTDRRVTRPLGGYGSSYLYNNAGNGSVTQRTLVVSAPPLLGGYYFGNYCDSYVPAVTYPSIYAVYTGFPQYIVSPTPNVIIVGQPMPVAYVTSYLPFDTPNYPVTYDQNDYYAASGTQAQEIEGGGAAARAALKNAYPADSYQAAFADIARAWIDGDIAPLRTHIRDTDTRISVFLNTKYSYSIASGDFVQITRDALDRLHTSSFAFTRLRKAKNGDVTAYGAHVYRTDAGQSGTDSGTMPFDQDGTNLDGNAADPAMGAAKTVYVSYTLRHRDGQWYIVEIDSSDHSLVPAQ